MVSKTMSASSQARTKMVVLGLKGALKKSSDLNSLTDLVQNISKERFHVYGLLALYANKLVHSTLAIIEKEFTNENHQADGKVFNVNAVGQAFALVHAGESPGAPVLLCDASKEYFSGPLAYVRATRPLADLQHAYVRLEACTQIVTALSNCMEYATPANQKMAIRQMYELTNKEAKQVCLRLSTSRARFVDQAIEVHVKIKKRIVLKKRDELDKALRDGDPGAKQLQSEFDALEKEMNRHRQEAKLDSRLAAESLAKEYPLKARVRPSGFVGPFLPLEEIVRREMEYIPATQSQMDQLQYRASLIRRL